MPDPIVEETVVVTPEPITPVTPTETPTPKAPESKAPDLAKVVESLTAKYGGVDAALRELVSENYKERDKVRELKAELKAKTPADGSRVLTADEAKLLDAYAGLGKPDDLKKLKAEHGTLASELTGLKRDEELRTFADRDGVKVKFSVLKTIAGALDFTHVVKVKDQKTGKESEVPAVKDGDAEPVAFDAYASKHWKDFLPALRPDARPEPHGTPRLGQNGTRPVATTNAAETPKPVARRNVF